ncbi:MAG: fused MFS/spermidine synthase [Eubacterium sp.]|nr:fused MFS/spermidine synthase [Eubacterium sp.]
MSSPKILNNKLYLYLTEFFSGMSVMAVELGASRLLAPYFSSSQIVWTIIIGTIMIAMALGNIMGGRWADKDPNPDKLYGRIIIAAIWIALIPVLGKFIIVGISGILVLTISTNFLVIAAFAACMVIFVFPLFLLGTVTPSLVKYTVDSLDESGKVVGYLNASNTIGSIIGTFVPTFISIPAVGTSITFLIFAGILMALAILYFISARKKSIKAVVGVIILIIACIFGHNSSFAFWEKDLVYEGESIYNYLQVSEDDSRVVLSTNVLFGVQSVYSKEKKLTGMYYDYAMAAPYMAGIREKGGVSVLILGMGTGTYATQCRRYFDNVEVEGVEIDGKITDLAHKYFELPTDVKVTTYDGRAYLQGLSSDKESRDKKYDVIMIDAYQDITVPFQMSSVEFFSLVKEHLADDGVIVVNMNMISDGEDGINTYLSDTISEVFPYVYTADVQNNTNRELFASNNEGMIDEFRRGYCAEDNEEMYQMMGKVDEGLVKYAAGDHILTDDKAPVELLSMNAIDALIRNEVEYYKSIYKEKGLSGLMDELF